MRALLSRANRVPFANNPAKRLADRLAANAFDFLWYHPRTPTSVPGDESKVSCLEFDVDCSRTVDLPLHPGGDRNQSVMKLLRRADAEKRATDKFTLSIPWDEIKPYWWPTAKHTQEQ